MGTGLTKSILKSSRTAVNKELKVLATNLENVKSEIEKMNAIVWSGGASANAWYEKANSAYRKDLSFYNKIVRIQKKMKDQEDSIESVTNGGKASTKKSASGGRSSGGSSSGGGSSYSGGGSALAATDDGSGSAPTPGGGGNKDVPEDYTEKRKSALNNQGSNSAYINAMQTGANSSSSSGTPSNQGIVGGGSNQGNSGTPSNQGVVGGGSNTAKNIAGKMVTVPATLAKNVAVSTAVNAMAAPITTTFPQAGMAMKAISAASTAQNVASAGANLASKMPAGTASKVASTAATAAKAAKVVTKVALRH